MICSTKPLFAKSFTYIVVGSVALACRRPFNPMFPTMKSTRPFPMKSPATMRFHQPLLFSSPGTLSRTSAPVLVFLKIVIGIHSPTRINSGRPSPSRSCQTASVTMPTCLSMGATLSVTSVKCPLPSLCSNMLGGSMP